MCISVRNLSSEAKKVDLSGHHYLLVSDEAKNIKNGPTGSKSSGCIDARSVR